MELSSKAAANAVWATGRQAPGASPQLLGACGRRAPLPGPAFPEGLQDAQVNWGVS